MRLLINACFDVVKGRILNDSNIGPLEKNNIIENIIFIKSLYFSGIISIFEFIDLFYKALI